MLDVVLSLLPVLVPAVLGFVAVYALLPRVRPIRPLVGGAAAGLALATAAALWLRTDVAPLRELVLFYAFSGLAIVSGGLLITQKNPVRAALCFALVVLSTCGLFLLQAAPFLMATTIIVYAGAIVVTFLFVIMLAQQAGISDADQRSREPFLGALAGFVLLGALVTVLPQTYDVSQNPSKRAIARQLEKSLKVTARLVKADERAMVAILDKEEHYFRNFREAARQIQAASEKPDPLAKELIGALDRAAEADFVTRKQALDDVQKLGTRLYNRQHGTLQPDPSLPLSGFSGKPPSDDVPRYPTGPAAERLPADNVAALGRTLFTDYLLAVVLAGVLLLVATIGAIAIAARRLEGRR